MQSKIVSQNGKLLLDINGEVFAPHAYMSYVRQRADYDGFKKNGCRLFFTCMYMGDTFIGFEPHIWKAENEYDFTVVKNIFDDIIKDSKVGEIYLFIRVNLNAPKWWMEKYPNEIMQNEEGGKWLQSPCSKKWLEDCEKFLSRLQKWIVENGYEEYIAGWHLGGLATEEWIIPESKDTVFDFSPVGIAAFQTYCAEKYGDIESLNKAWCSNFFNFKDVKVPSKIERNTFLLAGQYRKYGSDTCGADYFAFCCDSVSDAIIRLASYCKNILNHKILIGVFYGYILQLPAWRGHSALGKILACEDVDFFASPFAYCNLRQGAHDWFYHGAMNSATHAGKIWFLEADVRTYLTEALPDCCPWLYEDKPEDTKKRYYEPVWFGPKTEEQTKHHLTRSLGKVLASGHAFWWFDMWGSWYKTDGLMSHIKYIEKIYEQSMLGDVAEAAEVALIVDEKMSISASLDRYCELMYDQVEELGTIGAPYDIYLFEDLQKIDFSKYKTLIFVSALNWSNADVAALDKLKSDNRSILFVGLPGLYSNNSEKLLGINYEMKEDGENIDINPKEDVYEIDSVYEKENENYRVWWSHFNKFKATRVRNALKKAGGHVYSDEDAIVYANEKYIIVTATKTGEQSIFLPEGKMGAIIANNKDFVLKGNEIILNIAEDETILIELKME